MQMEGIIVTTEDRLREIIKTEVGQFFKVETPKSEPANLSGAKSAVIFLRENGYEMSESLFTKQSAKGLIPCRRFQNKRLLFNKKELLLWAESKCEPIGQSDAVLTLAKNATRKLKR